MLRRLIRTVAMLIVVVILCATLQKYLDTTDQPAPLHETGPVQASMQSYRELLPWPAFVPEEKPHPGDQHCGPYLLVTRNERGTFVVFRLRSPGGAAEITPVAPEDLMVIRVLGRHAPDGLVTRVGDGAFAAELRLDQQAYEQATCLETLTTEDTSLLRPEEPR